MAPVRPATDDRHCGRWPAVRRSGQPERDHGPAYSAPDVLRRAGSVSELVGRQELRPIAAAEGPAQPGVQAIVLGDSVAAGIGGPPLPDATPDDEACERSAFAFAETLARVNDWTVDNLGCSGADRARHRRRPARRRSQDATAAGGREASGRGRGGHRQHRRERPALEHPGAAVQRVRPLRQPGVHGVLPAFAGRVHQDYYELLRQLVALPGDPLVVINQYYRPFDPETDCLADQGLTRNRIETLLDRLDTLNAVLTTGAETFGYRSVRPDFSGHELCTDQAWVQGRDDQAPLHPNARGQLVIALADERALLGAP